MKFLQSLYCIYKNAFVADNLKELEALLKKQGNQIGEGSSRRVYSLNSDYVAKIPLNGKFDRYEDKVICNLREYLIYRTIPKVPVAHCGLYFYKMIPVIVMEKVNTSYSVTRDLPFPEGWDFRDCFQGGATKDGQYLSYDVGYERVMLEKLGGDFSPFEFKYFSIGFPNFQNLLNDERTEYLQESLLTP